MFHVAAEWSLDGIKSRHLAEPNNTLFKPRWPAE